MKFLKFSAALAVVGCVFINSIGEATMKEEHELSGVKPSSKIEKNVSKVEAPSQNKKVIVKKESNVLKQKAPVKNEKKLPEMKVPAQNKKEVSKKESTVPKQKVVVQNEKELTKSKVAPAKKEFWNGMELPANFKSISIFGKGVATKGQAINLMKQSGADVRLDCSIEELVDLYWLEAEREGVRPDIAFAQAVVETGYFQFKGTVKPKQNNYCGLGTTGKKVKGAKFKTPEIGVRAHIQHLLAYSAIKKPSTKIVDPRYELAHAIRGERGYVDTWYGLNGTWAMGSNYCEKIMVTYQRMLTMEMSEAEKKAKLEAERLANEAREAALKKDKKYRKQMEKEAKERKKVEKEAKKRKQKEAEQKMHERVDKVVREEKEDK